jgi:hypothetical protein
VRARPSPADVPDLVGTWKLVGEKHAAVRHGAASEYVPAYPTPSYGTPGGMWTVVVERQEGRAFHGHVVSPNGRKEPLVGVLTHNSQRLVMSVMDGGMFGEVVGNQIEFCFQDRRPDRAAVACFMGSKE